MNTDLYLKWVKDRKQSKLTRTEAEFAEWVIKNDEMILKIGSFSNIFKSVNMWMKMNRELFIDSQNKHNNY